MAIKKVTGIKKAAPAKKSSVKKASAKKTTSMKAATKKAPAQKATAKKAPSAVAQKAAPTASKKATAQKDPEGGLTAAGRKTFSKKEGSHLRPGVQGAADTPEKMKRKGSFLRRHFANPRGPMERDGKPTRLALSAHAWGEPVPKTEADARELADKGHALLERYHASQEAAKKSSTGKSKAGPKTGKS